LGAVYDKIEMITNLIGRYAIFEDLYLRESSKASDLLKKAIIKLYASMLTYLAGAKRYYAQNPASTGLQRILVAPVLWLIARNREDGQEHTPDFGPRYRQARGRDSKRTDQC
jgi:hypothetical protein